jgi:hypothetical protein
MSEVEIGKAKSARVGYAFDDVAVIQPVEPVTPRMSQPLGRSMPSSSSFLLLQLLWTLP